MTDYQTKIADLKARIETFRATNDSVVSVINAMKTELRDLEREESKEIFEGIVREFLKGPFEDDDFEIQYCNFNLYLVRQDFNLKTAYFLQDYFEDKFGRVRIGLGESATFQFEDLGTFRQFAKQYGIKRQHIKVNFLKDNLEHLQRNIDGTYNDMMNYQKQWRELVGYKRVLEHMDKGQPVQSSFDTHFSYGPDGMKWHQSEEEARSRAEGMLADERSDAAEECWSEDGVASICWGLVLGSGQLTKRVTRPDDFNEWDEDKQSDWYSETGFYPDWDEMLDYSLMPPAPDSSIQAAKKESV